MVVDSTILRGDLHWLPDVLDWWRRRNVHSDKLDWDILKKGYSHFSVSVLILPHLGHMNNVGLLGDRHGDLVDPGRPCVVVVVVLVLVVVVVVLWLAVVGGGRCLMCSFYRQIYKSC